MQIHIKNITFRFGSRLIFDNFSLSCGTGASLPDAAVPDARIPDGDNPLMLLGHSGCGKTTLLRLIAGLLQPESGSIHIDGFEDALDGEQPAEASAAGAAAQSAPKIAFVFQEPRLLPHLSALENTALPLENLMPQKAALERARYFLRLCAAEDIAGKLPGSLSGGQQHRIALARAWAYPAPLILMDEPFQSLDIPLRIQLMDAARSLLQTENRFVIAVTHAPREALYLGNRIAALGVPPHTDAAGARLYGSTASRIVFDEHVLIPLDNREFVSALTVDIEKRIVASLGR
ncbi:MAG: ATP-binding cassette domain-containing protein [Spirochaetaceae bacterium]|nr:ATP-binding cassette domain-containing protein [Spirochaetaceae bacterium]